MTAPRQLLLVGSGTAHLRMLQDWARRPLPGVQITLIAADTHAWYAPRVAGLIAGHFEADDCQWALEPLVQRSGVQWLRAQVRTLQADARSVVLDDGRSLHFDALSINVPGVQDRNALDASLPGAREHAWFAHPLGSFCALWPQVLRMAQARPLRFTVVGAGPTGCELAMALQHRLPQSSVTLLAGTQPPLARYAPALQARVLQALRRSKLTVLQDRALSVTAEAVSLACGAALASDVTVLTTGQQSPHWLLRSDLTRDSQEGLAVDTLQRSTSHPYVFITQARAAGAGLARRLASSLQGRPLTAPKRPASEWQIVDCGDRSALAYKGAWAFQGAWVWWLARQRDQRRLRPWQSPAP